MGKICSKSTSNPHMNCGTVKAPTHKGELSSSRFQGSRLQTVPAAGSGMDESRERALHQDLLLEGKSPRRGTREITLGCGGLKIHTADGPPPV